MHRDTFLERKDKKKSWEQTDYAFKTFLAHLERLKKAPADKQDALVEDCAFFLAFAGRLVLQGVEIIYKETTGHLRERLFEAVAKTEKHEVPWAMARVWSFHNPNPGTFLWRYTQELLSSDTEGRYVAQVGEKAKRLLGTCNEKHILALKDFSFPNSNLIPEIINTSYDEEFLQDIDQLSSRDFRVSLVNVLNYGHEEKELKRKLDKIFAKRPPHLNKEDLVSAWVSFECRDHDLSHLLLTLYNQDNMMDVSRHVEKVFVGAQSLAVFDRHQNPLSLQDLAKVFVVRHESGQLSETFAKKLIEHHKDCVWLGASCKEALFHMVKGWKKQPQARVFELMIQQLNTSERAQILDRCRSENRTQLMKKIMKDMSLDELSEYKQRSDLWTTKQQQAFTMMFNKLQNKDLSQELSCIVKQKDTQKRKM